MTTAAYESNLRDRIGVPIVTLAFRPFTTKGYRDRIHALIVHAMKHPYCEEHDE